MDAKQKAEIVTMTRNMIVDMGVKALRMDDVAQAAHISKRTLYETFGDKEELLFLAIKEHFDDFGNNHVKATNNAPNILVAMLIIMEEIRKNAAENWKIRTSLKRFYPEVSKRIWNDRSDFKRKVVTSSLKKGIKQGYIDSRINLELTINVFTYISIGITENNETLNIPEDINAEDAFQEVLINYMRGISTIKGIEAIDNHLAEQREK